MTPLHVAVAKGYTSIVSLSLDVSFNVDLKTSHGTTPLILACVNRQSDAAAALLDRRAEVNLVPNSGAIPTDRPSQYCTAGQVQVQASTVARRRIVVGSVCVDSWLGGQRRRRMGDYRAQGNLFEDKCLDFYRLRLKLTVVGVSEKSVRAILEMPGWQIDLAKDPKYHAHAEQKEWRKEGARQDDNAADFLIEANSNLWIIAEAKSSKKTPDPHSLQQLEHTLVFARGKKKSLSFELHLLVPNTVDQKHLFTRAGVRYFVEAPFRDLAGVRAGKLTSANGTFLISGLPVWVVLIPSE